MKFKHTIVIFFIFAALISSFAINAQNTPAFCGTENTDNEWLKKYQANHSLYEKSGDTLLVGLSIHVFDSSATILFSKEEVLIALCRLNEGFAPAKIRFFVKDSIRFIVDTIYSRIDGSETSDMFSEHNIDSTINCYIVNSLRYCGINYGGTGIILHKSCIKRDRVWAHEIGHQLSLPHTFDQSWYNTHYNPNEPASSQIPGEPEMVDGSNCEDSGDRICDTPPDYLGFRWGCDESNYTKQTDPNGEIFYSDGSLIMSYSYCMSRFSDEQMEIMRSKLEGPYKRYLYDYIDLPLFPADVNIELISPIDSQRVINAREGVKLTWKAVPSVQFYIIQMNHLISSSNSFTARLDSFSQVEFDITTTDSFIIIPRIPPNSGFILNDNAYYQWRVGAYLGLSSCTSFSAIEQFQTDSPIWVNDKFDWTDFLEIYPNPISPNSDLIIKYAIKQNATVQLTIVDITGRFIFSQTTEWLQGENTHIIPLPSIPKGAYFLNIIMNEEQTTRKLILSGD